MQTQEHLLAGEAVWVFSPQPEENQLPRLYFASEAILARPEPAPIGDLIR